MGAVICFVILGECGATFLSSFLRTRLEGPTARDRPKEGERDTRNNCRYMGQRDEGGRVPFLRGWTPSLRSGRESLSPTSSFSFRCPGPPEKKVEGKTTGAQKVLYWWYQQKRGKTFFSSLLAAARRSRLAKKDEEVATKKKSKEKLSRKTRKGYCSLIHFVALGSAVRSPVILAVLCLELVVCFFAMYSYQW